MDLIIDVGNTRVKLAVFENDSIKELFVASIEAIIFEVKKIKKKYSIANSIISSVGEISDKIQKELLILLNPIILSSSSKVPFKNLYGTPQTLGIDRIALAAAAVSKYPQKNTLVIDAGTCITYEFVNNKGEYLGGAISPGLLMRYNALHKFTAKLPLLTAECIDDFIGSDTKSSMHSGVVNGVCKEIDGVIQQYINKYTDLTVVLTGGDTYFLAEQLKSVIFAESNFLLEGLHTILNYNLAND